MIPQAASIEGRIHRHLAIYSKHRYDKDLRAKFANLSPRSRVFDLFGDEFVVAARLRIAVTRALADACGFSTADESGEFIATKQE